MAGLQQFERIWQNLFALGGQRLIALALIGLTVFATIAFGSYYLSRPELETLYTGLNPEDIGRIGSVLGSNGIPFDVGSDGTAVLVPFNQTVQARMALAEKGLPGSENAGYKLFDKLGSMGLTSFMQQITRVRALEGEIARTIQAMKGIRAARVHIVLPDDGSFRRAKRSPSASVVIRTDWVEAFSAAPAIRHLVAAAIPGMSVERVTVLGTDGKILAAGQDSSSTAPGNMVGLEKTLSSDLEGKIRRTLAPYLGVNNFEISVAARFNTDQQKISKTEFDPESRVERSVRVVKESASSKNKNGQKTVTVEQNLPEEDEGKGSGSDQSSRENDRREELTNYELNSKITSTVRQGYKVENLSIAVVVNRERLVASLGSDANQAKIDVRLEELKTLISSAVGVDKKRGDLVAVSAVPFMKNGEALEASASNGAMDVLLDQVGSLIKSATMIIIVLMLIRFGLKPVTAVLLEPPQAMVEIPGEEPLTSLAFDALGDEDGGPEGGARAIEGSEVGEAVEGPPNLVGQLAKQRQYTPQKRLEQLVDLDEEQAIAIMKQWMHRPNHT
ncbi:MAG: flagellar basal-body MS-ring/collar protein FliF [Methyloligellaceae bacterium]